MGKAGGVFSVQSGLAGFVVEGITMKWAVFQPSDWAEQPFDRLAKTSTVAAYASCMYPEMIEGANRWWCGLC
jgi:hypothetical protein